MEVFDHLTDEEVAQIRNIIGGNPHKALEIMRDCAGIAEPVNKQDYADIMGVPLRTVQNQCKNDLITTFNIGKHKFPCINCNL